MQKNTAKVFGIGLSKTGTTSLARALEMLGYRTRDYLGVSEYRAGDLSCIDLGEIDENDAFTDTPIPSFYRELDERYQNSKFILTTRDMDAWLKSCKKQFTERITARQNEATALLHTDLYGCFAFDAEKYASGYTRHTEGVLDYFRDRPQDLLVIDICGGDNWERLCAFLGKPVPNMPFPVTNVSAIQWMDIQKIVSIAQQAGREVSRRYGKSFPAGNGGSKGTLTRRISGLFSGMLGTGQPDDASCMEKAAGVSLKFILEGLNQMNPSIPVVSPESEDMPFADREKQPYVWLVDPLGITMASPTENGSFSVSIALIEGGQPLWGIVYNPLEDTIYYAKGASGSYRIKGNGEPVELDPSVLTGENRHTVFISGSSKLPDEVSALVETEVGEYSLAPANRAIGLCLLAEGRASMLVSLGAVMEWETAAAHAIARASGKRVVDYRSGEDLLYNKKNPRNESYIAK